MQFVRTSPVIVPRTDAGSQYEYWALDIRGDRPTWPEVEEADAMVQHSAEELKEALSKITVVQCAAIYVDERGILFVWRRRRKTVNVQRKEWRWQRHGEHT